VQVQAETLTEILNKTDTDSVLQLNAAAALGLLAEGGQPGVDAVLKAGGAACLHTHRYEHGRDMLQCGTHLQ
jgi:hypothetical protein